jgi:hypothetical protein
MLYLWHLLKQGLVFILWICSLILLVYFSCSEWLILHGLKGCFVIENV